MHYWDKALRPQVSPAVHARHPQPLVPFRSFTFLGTNVHLEKYAKGNTVKYGGGGSHSPPKFTRR